MPHIAFIGLGSNLEDPRSQLQRAFAELDGLPETRLVAHSSLYRSAPLGYPDQPEFVNAVAKVATALTPQALLQALLQIEHEHGLTIPHPQMHLRAFVLQPLLEIAPDAGIPGMGRARQALQNCTNQMLEKLADAA